MLHRGLRMERHHRVLQLVRAEAAHDVRRDENERIADGDLAPPHVGLEVLGRQAPLAMRVGQRREARLADEVGLGRPDRCDVQLVAADDGHADPDRPVHAVALEVEAVALVGQALVGGRDRLLEADPDPRRLVVVVLAPDRLGGELRRLLGALARDRRGDDEVEVSLRPRDGSHARLDDDDRVGRVGYAIWLGNDAELHLETDGHAALS